MSSRKDETSNGSKEMENNSGTQTQTSVSHSSQCFSGISKDLMVGGNSKDGVLDRNTKVDVA